MRKIFIVFFVVFMFSTSAFATTQIPEQLIYEGKPTTILHELEISTNGTGITKLNDDQLQQLLDKNRMFGNPNDGWKYITSSACWRNYIGTWEIKNSKLFLNKIIGMYVKDKNEPLFAEWITGTIETPIGEVINDSYDPVFEKSFIIHVKNGAVIKTETVENKVDEN